MRIFKNRRTTLLFLIDALLFTSVYLLTMFLAELTPGRTIKPVIFFVNYGFSIVFCMGARIIAGLYSNVWRYANTAAYCKIILTDAISGIIALLITRCLPKIWYGLWEIVSLFSIACVVTLASRFLYQLYYRRLELGSGKSDGPRGKERIGVAIVGAGQTGAMLAEELLCSSHSLYRPVMFIDCDDCKVGGTVSGIKVYSEEEAPSFFKKLSVEEIIIALPGTKGSAQKRIIDLYSQTGYKVKIYDFPIGEEQPHDNQKRVIRDISIDDILFRKKIDVVDTDAADYYKGKTVLVTGGGGSIGSELCRQIARCEPRRLIILDIYENNAYDIQQELTRKYAGKLDLAVEIASVRDKERLDAVFAYYRPEVVFHAAAHKHVPLMEHSNAEAVKNNIFGTKNTADVAEKYGVKKFVLVSTDKAVNPTNVMGASKRMCEMVINCRRDSETEFCAVRFGNVLGSNGSVVPLFKRQIDEGGPITLTDKRIVRYFMTIPEAAGLVVQAGVMAKRGTLFVLDMGDPVKILGLAETIIKLSGLTPYVDIDIVEIGLRPGEKLYEELLIKRENLTKTDNDLIFIEEETPFTREEVNEKLEMLMRTVIEERENIASERITQALKLAVPTFKSPDEVNVCAERAEEMLCAKG
ncbi:MAG: polysaccharide biosynthesis protein [Clostridia bacterium]|nr:polysaccharide biosynthesis protein [Clostridia bacterium]